MMNHDKNNPSQQLLSLHDHDLYMYSHEGEPLIRKLAPLPLARRMPASKPSTVAAAVAGCSFSTLMAGVLFFTLFLFLSPLPPWSSDSTNTNDKYTKNNHRFRPFQKSWQRLSSTTSTKQQPSSEYTNSGSPLQEQQQEQLQQQEEEQSSDCRQILPAKVTARTDLPGFASYWNYANTAGAINVTYDERSLLIQGQRTLFLSGSMHPVRATRNSWNLACDEAVRNGLNMITIYIFWSAHQPSMDQPLDWSLPGNTLECEKKNHEQQQQQQSDSHDVTGRQTTVDQENGNSSTTVASTSSTTSSNDDCTACTWDLATAIRVAASRGLWIHLRLGPYDCAEYNYGGIPAWLPLQKPHMAMRRYDPDWLQAMQTFVTSTVQYLQEEHLWAYQGGPIVMAQIENELGGNDDDDESEENENMWNANSNKHSSHSSHNDTKMQEYANWCGDLVTRLEPNVIWTMCNGLSAPQTITTCNGVMGGHSCSTTWLEQFGESGRIQKSQPAFWTEAEQGFQVWGETSQHPSDYFWGTTSKDMAYEALRWFARGGASLNWYMWWGGYNRGRAAAAGIANMYASDAPLCPSGQRRQPKFGHLQALHESIADAAAILLAGPTALFSSRPIEYMNSQGIWEVGQNQRVFVYRQQEPREQEQRERKTPGPEDTVWREAHFVENDATFSTVVRFPIKSLGIVKVLAMEPRSSALVVDGMLRFDSAAVNPRSMSYTRMVDNNSVMMLDWQQWMEPRAASSWMNNSYHRSVRSFKPIEQTNLTVTTQVDSDYVWYETNLTLLDDLHNCTLGIETQKANAFAVFIDGKLVGTADNHQHAEGNVTLKFRPGHLSAGEHRVAILSESLGYFNLIGRWGASTRAKTKGITGDVFLTGASATNKTWRHSLLDGHEWLSFAGLHGEFSDRRTRVDRFELDKALDRGGSLSAPCTWTSALFDTPNYDPVSQALFVEITTGRGHLWLNGRDLGRFWNITRAGTHQYSQQYYLLPLDFLYTDGNLNELVFFNALDGDMRSAALVLSWTQESDQPNFLDQVDFPLACI